MPTHTHFIAHLPIIPETGHDLAARRMMAELASFLWPQGLLGWGPSLYRSLYRRQSLPMRQRGAAAAAAADTHAPSAAHKAMPPFALGFYHLKV